MKHADDIELGRIGTLFLVTLILVCLFALLTGCAHRKPYLWEMCRNYCATQGGIGAAVVGTTNPGPADKPACMCAPPIQIEVT